MADDYTIERTRSGFQYLIPGTERRTLPKCAKPEHRREGDQYVIPGAEPISTRELLSETRRQADQAAPRATGPQGRQAVSIRQHVTASCG